MEPLVADNSVTNDSESSSNVGGGNSSSGEVSIRIIGAGEHQGIGAEDEDEDENDGSVTDNGEGDSSVDASTIHVSSDNDAGFFVTIWITVVMFKSNDILRKLTTLKATMSLKLVMLMYYKNSRGHNLCRQVDYRADSYVVKSFFTALKALSKKEVHYGSHATPEQAVSHNGLKEKEHALCAKRWSDRLI
ncbi:hypothetical protein HAX54_038630 [Datura stramonium]|uniref:Uncharacterized protein n=1 Tax=Datura stramonium TaxID=4076 RepID=A0ABS8SIF9_DATST|nr:hypothetical protein [Datura stramonium]